MSLQAQAVDPRTPRTMSLPESLVARVDRLAKRERRSRSSQVAYLLELALDRYEARVESAAEEA